MVSTGCRANRADTCATSPHCSFGGLSKDPVRLSKKNSPRYCRRIVPGCGPVLNVGTTFEGCGHVLLPESTFQCQHETWQVNPMSVRKLFLAQKMVRIQILPMMPTAERDSREVRGLLPQSPGTQGVRVGRFDNGGPAAHSGADCAWKHSDPSQIVRASVRTPARPESFPANRHSPFRRQAPRQGRTPA